MRKFKYLRVLISALLVILGISAMGWFTWHLGKMFIGLVSAGTPDAQQEKINQTDSQILTLPQINLWTCQTGVFKEKKNADVLVESLTLKGWKAGIVNEEPYTVLVGVLESKDQAILLKSALAEDGIEAWVKEEVFPPLHYKISGKNVDRISKMLSMANSLLSGTEREIVRKELEGDMDFLFAGECPADFQRINNLLQEILGKTYAEADQNLGYQQDLLALFIEYKVITTKYFKNYK
jgi:hypothetical protein